MVANCEACAESEPVLVRKLIQLVAPYCLRFGFNNNAYVLLQLNLRLSDNLVDANQQIARALMNIGEFERAEQHYTAAVSGADAGTSNLFVLLTDKAFCLERLGKYEDGLILLDQAELEIRRLPSARGMAAVHNTRGAIRWRLKQYDAALKSFYAALAEFEAHGLENGFTSTYNNIGFTYYKMGLYNDARKYLYHSYRMDRAHDNINAMLVSAVNLGYVYAKTRRPFVGLAWSRRALSLAVETDNRFQQARARDAEGDALEALGRRDEAIEAWRKAIVIFDRCHAPETKEIEEKRGSL
jgi:tetratricopeptide (TPR) repeat protein